MNISHNYEAKLKSSVDACMIIINDDHYYCIFVLKQTISLHQGDGRDSKSAVQVKVEKSFGTEENQQDLFLDHYHQDSSISGKC